MPGLSQLKQFNADILSLGNEPGLRSSRGEKPVTVPIPKSIKDVDDSNDFVLGMPEISEEQIKANTKPENVVEDFSDIMGTASPAASDNKNTKKEEPPVVSGIDLSSLMGGGAIDTADIDLEADLSDFDEPEEEIIEETEPEPEKEPEIGDLSLDDLLSGAGFDGTEGVSEEEPEPEESEEIEEFDEASPEELMEAEPLDVEIEDITAPKAEEVKSEDASIQTADEALAGIDLSSFETPAGDFELSETDSLEQETEPEPSEFDLPDAGESSSDSLGDSDFAEPEVTADVDDDGFDELNRGLEYSGEPIDMAEDLPDEISEKDGMEDLAALTQNLQYDDIPESNGTEESPVEESSAGDAASADPLSSLLDGLNLDTSLPGEETSSELIEPSTEGVAETAVENTPETASASDSTGIDNIDFGDVNFDMDDGEGQVNFTDEVEGLDDFGSLGDLNLPDSESAGNAGSDASLGGDVPSDSAAGSAIAEENFGSGEAPTFGEEAPLGEGTSSGDEGSVSDDFLSGFDFNIGDTAEGDDNGADFESGVHEDVDISQMAGMEFPETDAQLGDKNDFELGSSDEFGMENGEFEIPGFSDVQTVEVNKNGKIKVPEQEKAEVMEGDTLPPNTLSDEQYEKFKKNLSYYPLNVRIAVEELIVKNEFTDDAEFEIIQKVLKKVSARQLASELEKMLDVSIPVPRDFERRTAEEYEAYKKSFQYQLRNRIIPGAIMVAAAAVVLVGLYLFGKNFIVRPMIANSLYKQGYEYLEQADYPQSEVKFVAATKYSMKKKWFFKYARGYREKKQYIRAEQMYVNILKCFSQDKIAGLEYAQMELDDLANYEKAEQILLREVLDYHINDQDALLLLGDTYLEWATEKDSSKFEDARNRYAEHIQLYGENDLNMARMLKYYVRTDDLKNVLTVKQRFMPKAKTLNAQGWTEMSGYLLDKLYGELAPSDEYLRTKIEDVKECLTRAVKADSKNPVARYNLARYYIKTHNTSHAKSYLVSAIDAFDKAETMKKRDLYKYIDSYRLLGEEYTKEKEYLRARELYTNGLSLYLSEHNGSGFEGNQQVGELYADLGDLDYFIAGDMDNALQNYKDAVDTKNDTAFIRYKIGYIQYGKKNFSEAIGSFMKAGDEYSTDNNLLLAMGNTLALRGDNYAAQGYYEHLLEQLDNIKEQKGVLFPQVRKDEAAVVESYLKASNNLGVTLFKLARRTGNSAMNAKSMVMFQDSMRAWDSMTRNQQTMVRLGGSNLAEQNMKYVSHPIPDYEPAIYTELSKTLSCEKGLSE